MSYHGEAVLVSSFADENLQQAGETGGGLELCEGGGVLELGQQQFYPSPGSSFTSDTASSPYYSEAGDLGGYSVSLELGRLEEEMANISDSIYSLPSSQPGQSWQQGDRLETPPREMEREGGSEGSPQVCTGLDIEALVEECFRDQLLDTR